MWKRTSFNQFMAQRKTVSYLSTLFSSYDVVCHEVLEFGLLLKRPSLPPCNKRTRCNWLLDQRSLSVVDCDGCNSERWGIKLHTLRQAARFGTKGWKMSWAACQCSNNRQKHSTNRSMNNVFTCAHSEPPPHPPTRPPCVHTCIHTHTRTLTHKTNHVK